VTDPTQAEPPAAGRHMAHVAPTAPRLAFRNGVTKVAYKRGWPGLFSGENQMKALERCISQLNGNGLRVAAVAVDRWSFWAKVGWAFVAIITLGFVVKAENLIIITEPIA